MLRNNDQMPNNQCIKRSKKPFLTDYFFHEVAFWVIFRFGSCKKINTGITFCSEAKKIV
jgi:hypothetical protein